MRREPIWRDWTKRRDDRFSSEPGFFFPRSRRSTSSVARGASEQRWPRRIPGERKDFGVVFCYSPPHLSPPAHHCSVINPPVRFSRLPAAIVTSTVSSSPRTSIASSMPSSRPNIRRCWLNSRTSGQVSWRPTRSWRRSYAKGYPCRSGLTLVYKSWPSPTVGVHDNNHSVRMSFRSGWPLVAWQSCKTNTVRTYTVKCQVNRSIRLSKKVSMLMYLERFPTTSFSKKTPKTILLCLEYCVRLLHIILVLDTVRWIKFTHFTWFLYIFSVDIMYFHINLHFKHLL